MITGINSTWLQQQALAVRDTTGIGRLAMFVCFRMLGATLIGRRWALIIDCGVLFSRKNKLCFCVNLAKIKCFLRSALLLVPVFLCSCGLAKIPLKPVLTADVKTIELAKLEANHILLIRRLNPIFAVMGSSGMLLDAVLVADHAHEYEKRAGPVNQMCMDLFTQTLAQELSNRGYKVGLSQKKYWDYYKKNQHEILVRTDAILRITLKQMGFWSKGLRAPFLPSLFIQAELIDPVSRAVLYSDRFAMGLDAGTLKVMALGYGEISTFPVDSTIAYQNFSDLLEKPEQSRKALLQVMVLAARHVAKGFRSLTSASQPVFNPRLFKVMPKIPLSDTIKLKISR